MPHDAPPQSPTPIRSRSTLALFLGTVAAYAAMHVTQPLLPVLSRDWSVSAATAGLTVSVLVLAIAAGSFVAGPLSDAVGRKAVMVGSLALLVLPTLACAVAGSFPQLLVFRALQGLLVPGVTAVAVAWAGDTYHPRDLRAAVGWLIASSVAGGLGGRLLGGITAERFGWRGAFVASALVSALGALGMARELPRGRRGTGAWGGAVAGMLRHHRDRRLLGGFLLAFFLFFGFIAVFTYLPFRLSGPPWRLSTQAVSFAYVVYLAGIVTSPLAGRMAQRVEPWRLILVGLAVGIAGLGLTLVNALAVVLLGLLVLVVGMFIAQAIGPSFVNEAAREAKGGANALYLAWYYAGGTVGSWLPGFAWERWGWPGVVASSSAAFLAGMAAVALLCRPSPPA